MIQRKLLSNIFSISSITAGIFLFFTKLRITAYGLIILGVLILVKPIFFKTSKERESSQQIRNHYTRLYEKAGPSRIGVFPLMPNSLIKDGLKQFYYFLVLIALILIIVDLFS